jgi:DNA-binding IclR family transcriptional regulator
LKRSVKKSRASAQPLRSSKRDTASSTSSVTRIFEVLDLFTEEAPVWSGTGMAQQLGHPRATTYRYIKSLCDVGLLLGIGRNTYALGPRIVQLDRQIQLTDPLLAAGRRVMPEVIEASQWGAMLLCSHCRFTVLCIHQETRKGLDGPLPTRRPRGMPISLFEGSASRAILANLKLHQARTVFLRQHDKISSAGLGDSWEEFRKNLRSMRQRGYVISVGSLGIGLAGVAAPIFDKGGQVIGSVTGVMREKEFYQRDLETLAESIMTCAGRISEETASVAPSSGVSGKAAGRLPKNGQRNRRDIATTKRLAPQVS